MVSSLLFYNSSEPQRYGFPAGWPNVACGKGSGH
jgi:hypothetical protein